MKSKLRFEAVLQKQGISSVKNNIFALNCKMYQLNANVLLTLVNEKVVNFLGKDCDSFYQKAFSLPDLRQELITYVLSRINILYLSLDAEQNPSIKHNFLYEAKSTLTIENIISQGVYDLLPQKNNWIKQQYEEAEPIAILSDSSIT